jgi:ABC-type transporter Mla subunit MlaD
MMRKAIIVLVIAVAVAGASIWLIVRDRAHHFTVRAYFHNAQGLKPDAKVRVNGLDVGKVKDVSLSPFLGDQPVEVLMRLDSRYAARIPNDSTATIATEGLLGPPYVEIDVSKASAGGPVSNNGVLRGLDTGSMPVLQFFLDALGEQSKKLAEESEKRRTIDSQNSRTKK